MNPNMAQITQMIGNKHTQQIKKINFKQSFISVLLIFSNTLIKTIKPPNAPDTRQIVITKNIQIIDKKTMIGIPSNTFKKLHKKPGNPSLTAILS